MKNIIKKSFAVVLTVLIILNIASISTLALSEAEILNYLSYQTVNGEATITDCATGAKGNMIIPSSINGHPVTAIGDSAFYKCTGLTSVEIPDSVTTIGERAFANCSALTSVRLSSNITKISARAFYYCSKISNITIPDNVALIDDSAFRYSGLTSVTIGSGVKTIGPNALSNCTKLTSVRIPDNVTSIGKNAFSDCSVLKEATIGNSLSSLSEYLFYGCKALTSIIIPDNIKSIGAYSFKSCAALTNVDIGSSVTSIGAEAFYGCIKLGSITIPNNVKTIGKNAFEYCSGLSTVNIGSSVSLIESNAFYRCPALSSINVAQGNSKYDSRGSCNAIIETATNTLLYGCKSTLIPDDIDVIGSFSFAECSSLTSLVIPQGVTKIGENAFAKCTQLKELSVPSSVKIISSSAFSDCTRIEALTLPDGVEQIDNRAFYNCTALADITLSDGIRSIGNNAFYNTGYYKNNSNWSDEVLYIGNHLIDIKSTFTGEYTVSDNTKTIASYAFSYCKGLTKVTVPRGIVTIETGAFHDCTSLVSVIIPESVTSIGSSAFRNCSALKEIVLPFSVSNIDASAFLGCKALTATIYNKSCAIVGNALTAVSSISGFINSTAQLYAEENNLNFIALDDIHTHIYDDKNDNQCNLCGDLRAVCSHSGNKIWSVTVKPTAISTGVMVKICNDCKAELEEEIIPIITDAVFLTLGEVKDISASALAIDNAVWSSSDPDVATIKSSEATAHSFGTTVIIAQAPDGELKSYCVVRVVGIKAINGAVADHKSSFIYGIDANSKDIGSFVCAVDSQSSIKCYSEVIGTGSIVNVVKNGTVIDSYEAVLFGDVNGDGLYDGMDSTLVSCIANGMLTKEQIGEVKYLAADCNHDGVVDTYDVELLNQAGLLMADINQNKTQ